MIDKVEPVKSIHKITIKPKPKEQCTECKKKEEEECNESFQSILDALLAERTDLKESDGTKPLSIDIIKRSWIYDN